MFEINWTEEALKSFRLLKTAGEKRKGSRQAGTYKQLVKCLRFLKENPRHPSLRTHVIHSFENPFSLDKQVFTAYVQNRTPGAYRVFWCYGPGVQEITILAITPHP